MRCRTCLMLLVLSFATASARAEISVLAAAAEVGITPESIVLADLQTHTVSILTAIESGSDARATLASAHQVVDAAAATVAQLAAALQVGVEDSELAVLVAQHTSAVADLQSRRQELAAAQTTIFQLATNGMPSALIACLTTCQQSAAYRVPPEFRVLVRTEEQWKQIEGSLRAEKKALLRGRSVPVEDAQRLLNCRSDLQVIAASQRLSVHLTTVRQLFQGFAPAS